MITKAERIYFTNPIGTNTIPKNWEGAKVLVTSIQYPHRDIQVGDVVEVSGHYVAEDGTFYYVTREGGRNVEGHLLSINPASTFGGRNRIAILGDDLFVWGHYVDRDDEANRFRMQTLRWSNPQLPANLHTEYGIFQYGLIGAPWAQDLMPLPGESEALVRAKVAQAKVRFEQKQKAAKIVKHGYIRGWLNLLEGLNNGHSQYMGYPRFNMAVDGKVLIPIAYELNEEQLEEARQFASRRGIRDLPISNRSSRYVSAQYTAVVQSLFPVEVMTAEGSVEPATAFRNYVRRETNDYSLETVLENHQFILAALNS